MTKNDQSRRTMIYTPNDEIEGHTMLTPQEIIGAQSHEKAVKDKSAGSSMSRSNALLPCWVSIDERLPDVGVVKDGKKGWLVWDGEREYYTTTHPSWWNLKGDYDDDTPIDAPVVVKWLDAPPAR